MDREHRLHARAEKIAALLEALWGDQPPISPNPQMTALIDAVAGDDEHGRASRLVVHGDELTYAQLAQAVLDPGPRLAALARLPPRLLQRLIATGVVDDAVSPGMAALPDQHCGAWELEAGTGTISYDATCARLMGNGHTAGAGPFALQLDAGGTGAPPAPDTGRGSRTTPTLHPDDRSAVVAALRESLSTGQDYEMRFRVLLSDGTWAWRASRARLLPATATTARRLVGFIAAEDVAFTGA